MFWHYMPPRKGSGLVLLALALTLTACGTALRGANGNPWTEANMG